MPSPPRPRIEPGGRLPAVDGLRGGAVLLVLVHHFVELQLPHGIASWQAYLGAALGLTFSGVDLFFVISGFLIGGILMDQRGAPNFYQVFYLRRALRIIPLFYIFLLACWTMAVFAPGVAHPTYPLGSYLVFLCNIWMAAANTWDAAFPALAWSLAIEEQFYLFFPWLVRICPTRVLLGLTLAALFAAPALRVGLLLVAPQFSLATHVLAPCRMDSLAFGVLVAFAMRTGRIRAWLAEHPRAPFLAALAAVPVLALLTLSRARVQTLPMAAYGYTTLDFFYAAVLLMVLGGQPRWFTRLCELRLFVFTGRISYFVYLFHGIVAWFVFHSLTGRTEISLTTWSDVGLIALTIVGLLAAGAVSWTWFESKLIALGRRFSYLPSKNFPAGRHTPAEATAPLV